MTNEKHIYPTYQELTIRYLITLNLTISYFIRYVVTIPLSVMACQNRLSVQLVLMTLIK